MNNEKTSTNNPLNAVHTGRMTASQWLIVLICLGLLALDGYDVLSISFAAPGMTEEWGLSKAALGVILPLELLGKAKSIKARRLDELCSGKYKIFISTCPDTLF